MKITDKENRIQSEFQKLLPGVIIHPFRSGSNGTINKTHYSIHPENLNLKDSLYSYRGELKFIHFSSLYAIQSILTNKIIKLYNLHNLNDPREYSFAGDLLTFNSANKEDAKKNMYLLSMCKTDILTGPAELEYNMWRLYGHDGSGICIEFDFSMSPPQNNWRDYFLSEVFYGAKARKKLTEVKRLLAKYEKENPKSVIDLGQIVTFHKSNLYRLENEVRLLYDCRENKIFQASIYYDTLKNQISPIIDSDITKSIALKKDIKYLELPIYHSNFRVVNTPSQVPVPKIERLILGHFYKDNFKEVADKLTTLAKQRLGDKIKVELSRMAKYYYDN